MGADETTEQPCEPDLMRWIDLGHGFVQQQYRGMRGECAQKQDALSFPANSIGQAKFTVLSLDA